MKKVFIRRHRGAHRRKPASGVGELTLISEGKTKGVFMTGSRPLTESEIQEILQVFDISSNSEKIITFQPRRNTDKKSQKTS